MKDIILWLWQLPQHLLALLLIKILKADTSIYQDGHYMLEYKGALSCFSLGDYIFVDRVPVTENTWLHERGHSKQSLILGWLYLLVIGLPSVIGNLLHRKIKFDYYKQPWEAWADRLGGVTR